MKIDLEQSEIRKLYDKLERQVLLLIAVPIPFFAIVYLFHESGNRNWVLPQISSFWESFGLSLIGFLLAIHFFNFHQKIKSASQEHDLYAKMQIYSKATLIRFWMLFLCTLMCAFGLFLFANAGYVIAFAITLLLISLGKPTPDRIIRQLKLNGSESEKIEQLKVRQEIQ